MINNYAIGKWIYFNFFESNESIDVNTKSKENILMFDCIYFLPDNKGYWIFEKWDDENLYIHHGGDDPILVYSYEILEISDELFLKLKDSNDDRIYLFRKVDNKAYTKHEIGKHDNIKYDFVMDENVLGEWFSIDFREKIDLSNLNFSTKNDNLFVKSINFEINGSAQMYYYNGRTWNDSWTKNILIDNEKETAAKYFIEKIDNEFYLILEWKMGNYLYGGKDPEYYIFKR